MTTFNMVDSSILLAGVVMLIAAWRMDSTSWLCDLSALLAGIAMVGIGVYMDSLSSFDGRMLAGLAGEVIGTFVIFYRYEVSRDGF